MASSLRVVDALKVRVGSHRARMVVRSLDQQDKRWLQSVLLVLDECLYLYQPPGVWRRVSLANAQVVQDGDTFELSTARRQFSFKARSSQESAAWCNILRAAAENATDNSMLELAEHMITDLGEMRLQSPVIAASQSALLGSGKHKEGDPALAAVMMPRGHLDMLAISLPSNSAVVSAVRSHGRGGGSGHSLKHGADATAATTNAVVGSGDDEQAPPQAFGSTTAEKVQLLTWLDAPPAAPPSDARKAARLLRPEVAVLPHQPRPQQRQSHYRAAPSPLLLEAAALAGVDEQYVRRAYGSAPGAAAAAAVPGPAPSSALPPAQRGMPRPGTAPAPAVSRTSGLQTYTLESFLESGSSAPGGLGEPPYMAVPAVTVQVSGSAFSSVSVRPGGMRGVLASTGPMESRPTSTSGAGTAAPHGVRHGASSLRYGSVSGAPHGRTSSTSMHAPGRLSADDRSVDGGWQLVDAADVASAQVARLSVG